VLYLYSFCDNLFPTWWWPQQHCPKHVVDKSYTADNIVVLWLLYPYRIITLGSNKHNGDEDPWSFRSKYVPHYLVPRHQAMITSSAQTWHFVFQQYMQTRYWQLICQLTFAPCNTSYQPLRVSNPRHSHKGIYSHQHYVFFSTVGF